MILAKKCTRKKTLPRSPLLEDMIRFIAFSSNTICFITANCRLLLTSTHVVLFKSPRDIQQIDHSGRQLNKSQFIRDFYQKATSYSYGLFLIDFELRTSESLRFCSNITGPGPTLFYLHSSLPKATSLTNGNEIRAYSEALAKEKESSQKNFM